MTTSACSTPRRTVLLVEDDVDARDIYATSLRHAGHHVIEAPTIREAEGVVCAVRPDAVVLGCRLPDGDGLMLVNRWRDELMGHVPVIVVTAYRERRDIDAALLAGADYFVPKPCPGSVLAAYVARATARTPSRRIRRVPAQRRQ